MSTELIQYENFAIRMVPFRRQAVYGFVLSLGFEAVARPKQMDARWVRICKKFSSCNECPNTYEGNWGVLDVGWAQHRDGRRAVVEGGVMHIEVAPPGHWAWEPWDYETREAAKGTRDPEGLATFIASINRDNHPAWDWYDRFCKFGKFEDQRAAFHLRAFYDRCYPHQGKDAPPPMRFDDYVRALSGFPRHILTKKIRMLCPYDRHIIKPGYTHVAA